jgi:Flp pilus assembly CpaE family ATPase
VGYVDGSIGDPARVASLAALFPNAIFESVGPAWPERHPQHLDILVVPADVADIQNVLRRLRVRPPVALHTLVILNRSDANTARVLAREGAAEVLQAPVGDAALALCVERLLSRENSARGPARKQGQVVALLKAGGGVGATALGVQIAGILAPRAAPAGQVCFADLDIQFGVAALYFDLPDALTVAECLPVGDVLDETQFAEALATHSSGARVLAAPRQLTPLDVLTPHLIDALIGGLKRDFALTIIDLPSVWTPWTNRALQLADRIVLVTQLSVPHVHLLRRQMNVLSLQKLDDKPLLLVCNALSSEHERAIPLKAAQKAIDREFDHVVPEDRRLMLSAINQGVGISAVRRGTKIERAIAQLADAVTADALTGALARRGA